MTFHGRRMGAAQQELMAERRRREDAAPRLRDVIPNLRSMRLRIQDQRADGGTALPAYTRHVIVETGPALFAVRCSEARCNGRHELTDAILSELRKAHPHSEGVSSCPGAIGDALCDRQLSYTCEAEFKDRRD